MSHHRFGGDKSVTPEPEHGRDYDRGTRAIPEPTSAAGAEPVGDTLD